MNRLNVLVCAFACHPTGGSGLGSGEDVLGWNLVQQIARFNETSVLTYVKNEPGISKAINDGLLSGVDFNFLDLPSWLRPLLRIQGGRQIYAYLWQIKAYLVARGLHQEKRFDLYHHTTYANDWMASHNGALLPVAYVRGPGGGAHRTPKGFDREYSFAGRIWESIRSVGQLVLRLDPFFIKGQSRAGALLVCNKEAQTNIPKRWSGKVHIYPVSGITSKDLGLKESAGTHSLGRFEVLTAGTLIKVKGFGLALKAFKEFTENYPDTRFSIIGNGPEEPRLRSLVKELRLEDKVRFLSSMPRDDVLRKMTECDVFLFPSLRDGGGTVAIEAMAVGRPVVCLDTGGPSMHVTDQTGFKIAPTTPEESVHGLAAALGKLAADDDLRKTLGDGGHERAEEVYHWDRLGERLKTIYDQAAAAHER